MKHCFGKRICALLAFALSLTVLFSAMGETNLYLGGADKNSAEYKLFTQNHPELTVDTETNIYLSTDEIISAFLTGEFPFDIQSMQQLHEKIVDMNARYYDLRCKIVSAERRIAALTERGEMWAQYNRYKAIRKQLDKVKPAKRELFEQRHSQELAVYEAAARYLKELKDSGEALTPKTWGREIAQLTAEKEANTLRMKAMRDELKAAEQLRKAANLLARQEQHHKKEEHEL